MNKRIVYQLVDQPVAILIPCECGMTIEQIGRKDVPAGAPFWIVGADSIPSDRSMRDTWELDVASMGEPAGFGGAT